LKPETRLCRLAGAQRTSKSAAPFARACMEPTTAESPKPWRVKTAMTWSKAAGSQPTSIHREAAVLVGQHLLGL
jgi:hypothetical protein